MNKNLVIEENYNNWTQFPFDTTTIENVKSLKNTNPLDFEESFIFSVELELDTSIIAIV